VKSSFQAVTEKWETELEEEVGGNKKKKVVYPFWRSRLKAQSGKPTSFMKLYSFRDEWANHVVLKLLTVVGKSMKYP